MSLAIIGLFKALSPLFPTTPRRFAPAGSVGLALPRQGSAKSITSAPVSKARCPQPSAASRPLRVMRWVDQESAASCAGRMVMSGRFDDVCAELDRLVALESAREATRPRH